MTAKDKVLAKYPDAVCLKMAGFFVGGQNRYEIYAEPGSKKMIGCSANRPSWAWADAARKIREPFK